MASYNFIIFACPFPKSVYEIESVFEIMLRSLISLCTLFRIYALALNLYLSYIFIAILSPDSL